MFGNEVGERIRDVKRAWQRAVLKAHGHTPRYVVKVGDGEQARRVHTALLTPESQAALRTIDLHFHDLRREAGSRWLEGGVPLHRIQKWLGHANISQTSTYLMAESVEDDDVMRRFDARVQRCATDSETGGQNAPLGDTTANSNTPETTGKHH